MTDINALLRGAAGIQHTSGAPPDAASSRQPGELKEAVDPAAMAAARVRNGQLRTGPHVRRASHPGATEEPLQQAIAGPSMNDLMRQGAGVSRGTNTPPAGPPARSTDREAWQQAAREAADVAVQADPAGAFTGRTPTAGDYLASSFGTAPDFGGGSRGDHQPETPDVNQWLRGAAEDSRQRTRRSRTGSQ